VLWIGVAVLAGLLVKEVMNYLKTPVKTKGGDNDAKVD